MSQFLYSIGAILYQTFTLWLAVMGVLLVWDIYISKCRGKRNRVELESWGYRAHFSFSVTIVALLAGSVDHYLLTPTLGAGINFFFEG